MCLPPSSCSPCDDRARGPHTGFVFASDWSFRPPSDALGSMYLNQPFRYRSCPRHRAARPMAIWIGNAAEKRVWVRRAPRARMEMEILTLVAMSALGFWSRKADLRRPAREWWVSPKRRYCTELKELPHSGMGAGGCYGNNGRYAVITNLPGHHLPAPLRHGHGPSPASVMIQPHKIRLDSQAELWIQCSLYVLARSPRHCHCISSLSARLSGGA